MLRWNRMWIWCIIAQTNQLRAAFRTTDRMKDSLYIDIGRQASVSTRGKFNYRISSNRGRPQIEAALVYKPQLIRHGKNTGRPRIQAAIIICRVGCCPRPNHLWSLRVNLILAHSFIKAIKFLSTQLTARKLSCHPKKCPDKSTERNVTLKYQRVKKRLN